MRNVDDRSRAAPADGALLERFVSGDDEASFALLVQRYGALVLSVCRRVLGHEQDAEDAFQATFLVLVRKARSIRKQQAVGSWLHSVAYRIARKAKARRTRQPVAHDDVDMPAPDAAPAWLNRELGAVLDEEVDRLPATYRQTFVLCYLEGKTNEQAAQQLGCPLGTVLSRLSRARERLRARLTARGLGLPAAEAATVLGERAPAAVVPDALATATRKRARAVADGQRMVALPGNAGAWAEAYLRRMFWGKLARIAFILVVLMLLSGGAFLLLGREPPSDRELLQGTWDARRIEFDGQVRDGVGMQLVFTADKATLHTPFGPITADYKLDPDRTPKTIDMQRDPQTIWPGIYEISGNKVRICLNQAGRERPTDFVTQPGSGLFVYMLER